ncbi:MAG: hypothetical protein Q4E17_05150 [Synergistes sp.]|nr:hypothetical protein [Synergistes sp.]
MGKADKITRKFMSHNDTFADAYNAAFFGGREIIKPSSLRPMSEKEIVAYAKRNGRSETEEKIRDVMKNAVFMTDGKVNYAIDLGIECQTNISRIMPVRIMGYNQGRYAMQIDDIAHAHKAADEKPTNSGEFFNGFYQGDKLTPVVTLVINFSSQKWDAPKSLFEMFSEDIPEELKPLIQDYKITVLSPYDQPEEYDKLPFRTSLKPLMYLLKKMDNLNELLEEVAKNPEIQILDRETAEVFNTLSGANIEINEKEGAVNMCKAFEELRRRGISEGEAIGENKFSQLINSLLPAGRVKDLERAANDSAYRNSLFAEFGIA